jgi:hypothetical protein
VRCRTDAAFLALGLAAAWLTPLPLNGQAIVGRVLDEITGTPVVAADVQLLDAGGSVRGRTVADTAGWFRITAPLPGTYHVRAVSLGYAELQTADVALDKGVELELELRLGSAAVPLQPLRVISTRTYRVGRLSEYYDRAAWTRKTGLGRVFMRDDIERISPFDVSTLLRMVPARSGCATTYMLDGLPIDLSSLDSMIQPQDVEGIEIYRGINQVPPEYAFRARCGLVLIWTRPDLPGAKPFSWKRILIGAGVTGALIGILSIF